MKKAVEQATDGSREQIAAQNRYDDAVYTIGRNKLVRQINDAATDAQRIAADRALVSYDQKHLGTMKQDNEQYRELVDRINSTKADIRSTSWNTLIRQYNENRISNQRVLDFAKSALREAQGAPDQQDWEDRVYEFGQRIQDEKLTQLQQDYQMGRVDGSVVLAFVNQRLATMSKDSPRWADLNRWREDFAKSWHADEAAQTYSEKYNAYQEGRLGDDEWLQFLHQRVKDADPGSEEQRAAKHDLVMETFRITENKLTYDVQVNGADPRELIRFYQTSLLTMDHDSARAMDIQQKIQQLELHGVNAIDLNFNSTDTTDPSNFGHYVGGNGANGNPAVTGAYNPGGGKGTPGSASEAFVQQAMQLLGTRYVLGAESASATDCSGLIYQAFQNAGLGSLINGQRKLAQGYTNYFSGQGQFTTDRSQVQRGDLVVYGDGNRVTHIGIYLGNGKVLSALTDRGVAVTNVGGLNVQIKGYLLVDWSKAPGNFTVKPVHTPTTPEKPGRIPNAPDDTPEGNHVRNTGKNVDQIDPASQTATVPHVNTQDEQAPAHPTEPKGRFTTSMPGAPDEIAPGRQGQTQGQPADNGSTANIPGALRQMAERIVSQIGGNPNNEQAVRSVATWLATESGSTVSNNNPFNLTTAGAFDLNGQIGRTEQGLAVFRTWQDGADAAAQEIKRHYPTIANAIQTGNAQQTLAAIEKSNWRQGGYGNTLIPKYNQSAPTTPIIGTGSKVFDTPQSMQTLAAQHPEVVDLFNINAGDPGNKAWYDENLHNLEQAMNNQMANRSSGTWLFVKPDGTAEWLPFSPDMYYSALDTKAAYQDMPGANWGNGFETRDRLTHLRTDVTMDQWQDQLASLNTAQQAALRAGDIATALVLGQKALDISRTLLGLPDGAPLDTAYYPGSANFGGFTADQLGQIQDTLESLLPQTIDNPRGNTILGLLDPEAQTPTGQPAIVVTADKQIHIDPNAAYFRQDTNGDLQLVTWKNGGDDFDEVFDASNQPYRKYMQTNVGLDLGLGVPVWTSVGRQDANVGRQDVAGYRLPAQVAMPGQVPGSGVQPVPADFGQGNVPLGLQYNQPGALPPAPWTQPNIAPTTGFNLNAGQAWSPTSPGNPRPTAPPPDPKGVQVVNLGRSLPVYYLRYKDPDTGEWFQAYSLTNPASGAAQWVFKHDDNTGGGPLTVLNSAYNDKVRLDATTGHLQINTGDKWEDFNLTSPQVPLDQLFHWYGTDPADSAKGTDRGAPGQTMQVRLQVGTSLNANFHGLQWWNPAALAQQTAQRQSERAQLIDAKRGLSANDPLVLDRPTQQRLYQDFRSGEREALPPVNNPFAAQTTMAPIQPRLSGSTVAAQARFLANSAIAAKQAWVDARRTVPPPPPVVKPSPPPPVAYRPPATVKPTTSLPPVSRKPLPPVDSAAASRQPPVPPAPRSSPRPPAPPISQTKLDNIPYRG